MVFLVTFSPKGHTAKWNTTACQKVLPIQQRRHDTNEKNLLKLRSLYLPIHPVLPKLHDSLVIWQAPWTDCPWKPNIICEGVYTQHAQTLLSRVEDSKASEFKESALVCVPQLLLRLM